MYIGCYSIAPVKHVQLYSNHQAVKVNTSVFAVYISSLYTYNNDYAVGGIVYFTVLCDHTYLVSLLFAVLVSLHPVTCCFSSYIYIYVGGIVYFTVLCDHPYLVSLLFAVLVSLHPVYIFKCFL